MAVGAEALNTKSGREVADASLVHAQSLFRKCGKCAEGGVDGTDSFVAYVTAVRDRVSVKNLRTGMLLWSKDVSTPVVEAHGMGGTKITRGALKDDEMVDDEKRDGNVLKEGGDVYTMPIDRAEAPETEGGMRMLGDESEELPLAKVDDGEAFLALRPPGQTGSKGKKCGWRSCADSSQRRLEGPLRKPRVLTRHNCWGRHTSHPLQCTHCVVVAKSTGVKSWGPLVLQKSNSLCDRSGLHLYSK